MKKIILLILILVYSFSIVGCNKNLKVEIYTEVIHEENELLSINYPIFNIKKLNNYIKDDIDDIINNFNTIENQLDSSEKELNIDYSYNLINDNIISVVINSYIYDSANSYENVYTYVFDYKQNKLLKSDDIVSDINQVKSIVSDKFAIDSNNISFYHLNNNKITASTIPLKNLNLKFQIEIKPQKEIVKYEKVNKIIDPTKPIIALTFDDGPSKYTNAIVELLKENDCNATFFVLGNKVAHYTSTLQNMLKNGNEIGNHSYNHKWLSRLSSDRIKEQIEKTQMIIQDNTGYTPTLLRPTYGAVNNKIRNNTDLDIILWTVDTMDWKIKNSKNIASNAIPKIKDGSIILMHDTYERTLKALKIMIPELKKQGYQFVTVSELKEIKKIREKAF